VNFTFVYRSWRSFWIVSPAETHRDCVSKSMDNEVIG
jgi:hypothetical protein